MAKNCKCLQHHSIGVKIMQKTKRVKNPGKQRKRLFNAPAHIRHKLMSAPLSSELASSRGVKTLPVRKGDTVRIMRGDNKGFEGKVSRVALKEYRIYMEGLTREKVDGTNIFLPIHPSKIQIRNLNLDDKWRKDILARKKAIEKPVKEEKPKAAPKETKEARTKPAEEVREVEQEKPEEAMPVEEVAPEVVNEEAPAAKIAEVEEAPEEAQAAKKTRAKKPEAKAARKTAAKEVPEELVAEEEESAPAVEEKAPAKKAAQAKAAAKKLAKPKEALAKKASAKETTNKPRVKSKATEGGQ